MINSTTIQSQSATDSYTDFSSVNAIRTIENKNQALEKIAEQFESMMVRMMMKSMRSANQVFAEGNFLSSHEGDTYQEMLDDQLALTLSQGKGMGLADVMVRQLKGRFGSSEKENNNNDDISDYLANRNNTVAVMPDLANTDQSMVLEGNKKSPQSIKFDGSVSQFVEHLYPMAEKAAKALGVEPGVLIAQSALETGWGVKVNGKQNGDSSFNFFNIKADKRWQGDSVTVSTMENRNGLAVKERAAFRSYSSPEQSFEDYVEFIRSGVRYDDALKSGSSEDYIRNLSEAGYATDPHYAEKILTIMRSSDMKKSIVAAQNTMTKG